MHCHIQACNEQAMMNRYFCPLHDTAWMESPERARAAVVGTASHTLSMMSDFARRIEAERLPLVPAKGRE